MVRQGLEDLDLKAYIKSEAVINAQSLGAFDIIN
jgi:hypothetical protein